MPLKPKNLWVLDFCCLLGLSLLAMPFHTPAVSKPGCLDPSQLSAHVLQGLRFHVLSSPLWCGPIWEVVSSSLSCECKWLINLYLSHQSSVECHMFNHLILFGAGDPSFTDKVNQKLKASTSAIFFLPNPLPTEKRAWSFYPRHSHFPNWIPGKQLILRQPLSSSQ